MYLSLFFIFTYFITSNSQSTCSTTIDDYFYDLTPLRHSESQDDYEATASLLEVNFYFNVCGNAKKDCSGSKGNGVSADLFQCMVMSQPTNSAKWGLLDENKPDQGVTLSYTNGDKNICQLYGQTPLVTYEFHCKPDAPTKVYEIVENPPASCKYFIRFRSSHACGVYSSTFSGGWSFLIIVFVLFLVYFLGGYVFNYTQKGLTGLEACPHRSFWGTIPGLVKDGCTFTYSCITQKGGTQYDYQDVDKKSSEQQHYRMPTPFDRPSYNPDTSPSDF